MCLLFGTLLYQGYFIFAESDYFRLKSVRVEGAELLDPRYVVELSGLELGMPMIAIDERAVVRNVLTDPFVARVEVLPEGADSLLLSIEERRPVARLVRGDHGYLIASDGMLLLPESLPPARRSAVTSGLPYLVGVRRLEHRDGHEAVPAEVRDALRRWLPVLAHSRLGGFETISVGPWGTVCLMHGNVEFILADVSAFRRHEAYIDEVLKRCRAVRGESPAYVDLRCDDMVVAGFAGAHSMARSGS